MMDLDSIAEKYELSPASIMNVVHYANETGLSQNIAAITRDLAIKEIKRETIPAFWGCCTCRTRLSQKFKTIRVP